MIHAKKARGDYNDKTSYNFISRFFFLMYKSSITAKPTAAAGTSNLHRKHRMGQAD